MSQQLVPVSGGTGRVETTVTPLDPFVLSVQYIKANKLESRPTEWVPDGRPIYRRLPAVSETYQIDFFNVVPVPNTAVRIDDIEKIGYVFVPWGESINGPTSMEVSASANGRDIIIKGGNLVWEFGTNPVIPVLINVEEVGITSGKYTVAYQLIYDDSPIVNQYYVEDFNLSGYPLDILGSTDVVPGWRYPAVNAFLNTNVSWKNLDTYFPSYAQPTESYIAWLSELSSAYSKIIVRCPSDFICPTNVYAELSYWSGTDWVVEIRSYVKSDSNGLYFELIPSNPIFKNGWRIDWFAGNIDDIVPTSYLDISVQSIAVTGTVNLLTKPSNPSTRASLVAYPENLLPKTVKNSEGVDVPATYCKLANVDIDNKFQVIDVQDLRFIIHRDYVPVADWLTKPFDDDLINLYEQVSDYAELWMSPPACMKQEYASLTDKLIIVN